MKRQKIFPIVFKDLFKEQLKWTFATFGLIILIVYLFNVVQGMIKGTGVDDFYHLMLLAGNIYMFVIGIYSIGFLKYLLEHGVSRANYFKGTLASSFCLALIIPIATLLIYHIQKVILSPFVIFNESNINDVAKDITGTNTLLDDFIVAAITTPYVDIEQQTFLALVIFFINLLFYYIAGWLIGVAFQYPVVFGLVITFTVGIIITVQDSLIRIFLALPLFDRFVWMENISKGVSITLVLLLLLLLIGFIQQLTRKTTVKI